MVWCGGGGCGGLVAVVVVVWWWLIIHLDDCPLACRQGAKRSDACSSPAGLEDHCGKDALGHPFPPWRGLRSGQVYQGGGVRV